MTTAQHADSVQRPALFPRRVTAIAALALACQPGGSVTIPGFSQARAFWYQWFLYLDQGRG
jgi:hypothetical protein